MFFYEWYLFWDECTFIGCIWLCRFSIQILGKPSEQVRAVAKDTPLPTTKRKIPHYVRNDGLRWRVGRGSVGGNEKRLAESRQAFSKP